jgi:hypothetical protein
MLASSAPTQRAGTMDYEGEYYADGDDWYPGCDEDE